MTTFLTVIHIIVSIFLIVIVLLQHGKGADIGATFGSSSQTLFGSQGPLPLLNKITTAAAIIFMATSISLAYISANRSSGSVMKDVASAPAPVEQKAPLPVMPAESPTNKTAPAPASPAPAGK